MAQARTRHTSPAQTSKYERVNEIIINNQSPADVILGPPLADGTLTFYDRITGLPHKFDHIETGIYYQGERKPKIVSRATQNGEAVYIDHNKNLLSYDHVLAVDTNTDPATKISATVMAWLRDMRLEPDGIKVPIHYPPAYVFENEETPEKFGWREALQRIAHSPEIQGRIAVIVDSYLNDIPSINSRTMAIIDDYFLPDGLDLIYSTADRDYNSLIGPYAIRACDRVAKGIIRMCSKDQVMPFHLPVPAALV